MPDQPCASANTLSPQNPCIIVHQIPSGESLDWLSLAPSIITLTGVLIVGTLTVWFNIKAHRDRLKREEIKDRREAWADFLAVLHEGVQIDMRAETEQDRFQTLMEQFDKGFTTEEQRKEFEKEFNERSSVALEAMFAKTDWQQRFTAKQMIAVASISDASSPMAGILSIIREVPTELSADEILLIVDALRADQELNRRKRKKLEDKVRPRIIAAIEKAREHTQEESGEPAQAPTETESEGLADAVIGAQ